jgi:hypothetical protein
MGKKALQKYQGCCIGTPGNNGTPKALIWRPAQKQAKTVAMAHVAIRSACSV